MAKSVNGTNAPSAAEPDDLGWLAEAVSQQKDDAIIIDRGGTEAAPEGDRLGMGL